MNTYSNDLNVHVFETLERSHFLSRISTGGIFDQVMPTTLIR